MVLLDVLTFYSFATASETIGVQYFFTKEGLVENNAPTSMVWLAIKTDQFTIKILKPEKILGQPIEVIQKIVEREVLQQITGESIAAI